MEKSKLFIFFTLTFVVILVLMTFIVAIIQAPDPGSTTANPQSSQQTNDTLANDNTNTEGEKTLAGVNQQSTIDSLEHELQKLRQEYLQLKSQQQTTQPVKTISSQEEMDKTIKEMAKIYENMDATRAATILSQLDRELAVKIIATMKKRKAAQVMAALDPAIAIELSREMVN